MKAKARDLAETDNIDAKPCGEMRKHAPRWAVAFAAGLCLLDGTNGNQESKAGANVVPLVENSGWCDDLTARRRAHEHIRRNEPWAFASGTSLAVKFFIRCRVLKVE